MSRTWVRRLWWGSIFAAVSLLVLGGLGWATFWALRLEDEQYRATSEAETQERITLALWRLDGRVNPTLAREDSRPFNHYASLHPPVGAIGNDGQPWSAGMVWLPSPLLNAELPEWVRIHFQVDAVNGWHSPQVVSDQLNSILNAEPESGNTIAVGDECQETLERLRLRFQPEAFIRLIGPLGTDDEIVPAPDPSQQLESPGRHREQWTLFPNMAQSQQPADPIEDYNRRSQTTQRGFQESKGSYGNNSKNYMGRDNRIPSPHGGFFGGTRTVEVHLGSLTPKWVRDGSSESEPMLVMVRKVRVDQSQTYQGLLLDWPKLRAALLAEVADLFPAAELEPAPNVAVNLGTERLMSSLPVRLKPGPIPEPPPLRWTPLRVGLAAGWAAALVALMAVGFAGRSLMALSDRRMRFASAVTHELRTPLTTLRLYVDMLAGGLVRDEKQRQEYFATLHAESDRLQQLIENVLDFSALEKRRPCVACKPVEVAEVMDRLEFLWHPRYEAVGKTLVIERPQERVTVRSDFDCLTQLLGTLLDNAQKHTRGAADDRVWLRILPGQDGRVAFEVEDRGEGENKLDGRIFRAFRQGSDRPTSGGVGLGLALAKRWAKLLGAKLTAQPATEGVGACFRLVVPSSAADAHAASPRAE